MIGLGGIWQIRNIWYYNCFFAISGIVQSVGWPSVVAIMANWFSKKGRGFWFGVWTANPNVGNIIGTLSCNILNGQIGLDWRWTWIIVSIFVGVIGIINFLFLVEHPARIGIVIREDDEGDIDTIKHESIAQHNNESGQLLEEEEARSEANPGELRVTHKSNQEVNPEMTVDDGHEAQNSINFFKAWLIPGVIQFSI